MRIGEGDKPLPARSHPGDRESVVIRCTSRVIKGYLESPRWTSADSALGGNSESPGDIFHIRHHETNSIEGVPAQEVKAIFFVHDLAGQPEHLSLQFHTDEEIVPGIWVHVKFRDGEVIEGIVDNSINYLIDSGFFLRPTDPGSNNRLVYVMKHWLVDHHVLGLTRI